MKLLIMSVLLTTSMGVFACDISNLMTIPRVPAMVVIGVGTTAVNVTSHTVAGIFSLGKNI